MPQEPRLNIKLDQRLAKHLADKKARLDELRPLPPPTLRRLLDDLKITFTYHSNAIEGNSLSLRETQMVIEYGLTVGGQPLKDYLEATNHAGAFELIVQLADATEPISVETILELHGLVTAGIEGQFAGRFRNGPVYIRGARVTPPPAGEVVALMNEWVSWIGGGGAGQQYGPVLRAAIAHHGFEAVHPFFDGNGRTGRLLLNLMLMREGYPPALLLRSWKARYIAALDTIALRGNYTPLANLIARAVESGLDTYLEAATPAAPEDADPYQPLSALAEVTGYRADYLSWLVRRGRISGVKRGGRWYTTRQAVDAYRQEVEQDLFKAGRPPQNR